MANQLTRAERILWRSIETQLESPAIGEIARGKLRGQLQAIRDGALVRQQQRAQCAKQAKAKKRGEKNAQPTIVPYPTDRFARRQAILAGVMFSAPTREDQTDESWEKIMASYRLDLCESACYRKLNYPKTSMSGNQSAERELLRIAKKRRELPDECESESRPEPRPEPAPAPAVPEPLPDLTKMSDNDLQKRFNWERFFLNPANSELIVALENEMRSRNLRLVWCVEGSESLLHVDGEGSPVELLTNTVHMGSISLAEDHPIWKTSSGFHALHMRRLKEERLKPKQKPTQKPTPTTAQSEYWNRGSKADVAPVVPVRDLKFVYQLLDETRFWNTGEVLPQNEHLLRTTQVLAAPDPPNYKQGSHVLPEKFVFDSAFFTWRKV